MRCDYQIIHVFDEYLQKNQRSDTNKCHLIVPDQRKLSFHGTTYTFRSLMQSIVQKKIINCKIPRKIMYDDMLRMA